MSTRLSVRSQASAMGARTPLADLVRPRLGLAMCLRRDTPTHTAHSVFLKRHIALRPRTVLYQLPTTSLPIRAAAVVHKLHKKCLLAAIWGKRRGNGSRNQANLLRSTPAQHPREPEYLFTGEGPNSALQVHSVFSPKGRIPEFGHRGHCSLCDSALPAATKEIDL